MLARQPQLRTRITRRCSWIEGAGLIDGSWSARKSSALVLWPRRRARVDAIDVIVVATPQSEKAREAEQTEPSQIHSVVIVGRSDLATTLHGLTGGARVPGSLRV